MDILREDLAAQKKKRRFVIAAATAAGILLITLGLSRLKPAAPTVDKSAIWMDTVKRGPMLRQVRGPGTLVPVDVQWISAPVDGRVERIPALPGVQVKADTVLLEMTDPTVEQNALDAESQLKAAQADYDNLKAKLE
ncbi:MAG: RND transporter, partial [Thermoanaerobaculia bacterium]